jgi:hypothetical protein
MRDGIFVFSRGSINNLASSHNTSGIVLAVRRHLIL